MVGRWISFWDGLFWGAILVWGRVEILRCFAEIFFSDWVSAMVAWRLPCGTTRDISHQAPWSGSWNILPEKKTHINSVSHIISWHLELDYLRYLEMKPQNDDECHVLLKAEFIHFRMKQMDHSMKQVRFGPHLSRKTGFEELDWRLCVEPCTVPETNIATEDQGLENVFFWMACVQVLF